jgi:hypothetical protein
MDEFLITTHELLRVDRSTPTTAAPVTVEFDFLIGYDCYARIIAEVITETDAEGFNRSYDVTILFAHIGGKEIGVYYNEFGEETREAIKEQAVTLSHHPKYHGKG